MKRFRNIDRQVQCWLEIDDIYHGIYCLQGQYDEDPIHVIDKGPLEFVANLRGLSCYYGDDIIKIAAVVIRTLIQDHPLQDGNKRIGMLLGSLFLENNGFTLICSDEDFFEVAMNLASGNMNRDGLENWLEENVGYIEELPSDN